MNIQNYDSLFSLRSLRLLAYRAFNGKGHQERPQNDAKKISCPFRGSGKRSSNCGKLEAMKKPVLRVTKWLKDIPVEGECTSCADSWFKVTSTSHRPNREEYQRLLQREFDLHVVAIHTLSANATQEWKSDRYAENAHFVPALGQAVLDLLAPQPGERILDLGCGDGVLSEKIKTAGATVVGADASADMIAAAKNRGIDARLMDGFNIDFNGEFDAVFSNAALHWMKRDPDAVISGVRRALKAGRPIRRRDGWTRMCSRCHRRIAGGVGASRY